MTKLRTEVAIEPLPGMMRYYALTGLLVVLFAGGLSFVVLAAAYH